jgi:hypothetical protein
MRLCRAALRKGEAFPQSKRRSRRSSVSGRTPTTSRGYVPIRRRTAVRRVATRDSEAACEFWAAMTACIMHKKTR